MHKKTSTESMKRRLLWRTTDDVAAALGHGLHLVQDALCIQALLRLVQQDADGDLGSAVGARGRPDDVTVVEALQQRLFERGGEGLGHVERGQCGAHCTTAPALGAFVTHKRSSALMLRVLDAHTERL